MASCHDLQQYSNFEAQLIELVVVVVAFVVVVVAFVVVVVLVVVDVLVVVALNQICFCFSVRAINCRQRKKESNTWLCLGSNAGCMWCLSCR